MPAPIPPPRPPPKEATAALHMGENLNAKAEVRIKSEFSPNCYYLCGERTFDLCILCLLGCDLTSRAAVPG